MQSPGLFVWEDAFGARPPLFRPQEIWGDPGACLGAGLAPGRQLVPHRPPGVRRPLPGDLHFMIFL